MVKRLGLHLTRIHRLKSSSTEYKTAMACAVKSLAASSPPPLVSATLEGLLDDFESTIQGLAGGSTEARPANQKRNSVSRILYAIMGDDSWSPAVLRRLKSVGEKPDGVMYRMLTAGKTASTVGSYVVSLLSFMRYLQAKPELLAGFCHAYELESYITYMNGIQKSASRLRSKHDTFKKSTEATDHRSLFAQLGRFNNSALVKRTFKELQEALDKDFTLDTKLFVKVRDCVMLAAEIWNARRAGDFCSITLDEWTKASGSTDPDDHIVFVRDHKTAKSELCPINFHGQLYEYCCQYVAAFADQFLRSGHLFPNVFFADGELKCRGMDESEVNRSFNRAWRRFRHDDGDANLPHTINSRMIRHRAVSAVHVNDDPKQMADAATAMSHSLSTARRYYNDGQGAAAISRGGQRLRQLAASSSLTTTIAGPPSPGEVRPSDVEPSDDEVQPLHQPSVNVPRPSTSAAGHTERGAFGRRKYTRPLYSPGHKFVNTNWRLQQAEVDALDSALADYYSTVIDKWERDGHRTLISNHSLIARVIEKGGTLAALARELLSRPGGAKKVGDHVRSYLKTRGLNKKQHLRETRE